MSDQRQPASPIMLSTGRMIVHTIDPSGSQRATPSEGPEEMTETEWQEYCRLLTGKMAKKGFCRV